MDQGHIIFRVLHHENISITMDAGVSLFFGLHGQYTISTAQENYTIGASEVYAVSPFTLYRTVSGEDAGVLQITLSPEILQKADWPQRQMIDCYLSRSTLTDSSRRTFADGVRHCSGCIFSRLIRWNCSGRRYR